MRFSLIRRTKFDFGKMFDESPQELDKIRRRAELRNRLKLDYNRFYYNPYSSAYGITYVDPQFERWYATQMNRLDHFRPHWGSFILFFLGVFGPYYILTRFFLAQEEEYWEKTQSGELTYDNRKICPSVFH